MMEKVQNDFNDLIRAYKFANTNITHSDATKTVKAYYHQVKKEPDSKAKIKAKCAEWKRKGEAKRATQNIASFFPASKLDSTSAEKRRKSNITEEKDVRSSMLESDLDFTISASAEEPGPSSATDSNTDTLPPPSKKVCHAELEVNKTIINLTSEIDTLETVLNLNIISNTDETRKSLRKKKEELKQATQKRNLLIRNRTNQKAAREKKKQKLKEESIARSGLFLMVHSLIKRFLI